MRNIGSQLRTLRQRRGVTIREVAAQLGCSLTNLAKKERGEVPITMDELDAYCKVLAVQWDVILGDRLPSAPLTDDQQATLAAVLDVLPSMSDSKARSLRVMLDALRDA